MAEGVLRGGQVRVHRAEVGREQGRGRPGRLELRAEQEGCLTSKWRPISPLARRQRSSAVLGKPRKQSPRKQSTRLSGCGRWLRAPKGLPSALAGSAASRQGTL